jgi:long-chain acyl-CoA synthetase
MGLRREIAQWLRSGEGGTALESKGVTTAWRDLQRIAGALDVALRGAGLGAGAVVGVLGRNEPLMAAGFLGLLASGRCAAPVNPFQPPDRIVADANAAGAGALLIGAADAETADWRGFQGTVWVIDDRGATAHWDGGQRPRARRAAILAATSGTTGSPKRIPLRYGTLERALSEIAGFHLAFGDVDGPGPEQPALVQYSPLAHIAGVLTLARGAATGRPVVLLEKFVAGEWAELVWRRKPRITGLPPAMMRMVLNADCPARDLESLVSVWSGSAPVDATVEQTFTARYGLPVLGNYGATEYCGAVATWSLEDYRGRRAEKSGAVGRIWPHVANGRVRDAASGAVLPPGDTGVLELLVHRVGPKWLKTTDLAHIDADGFLFLHGRSDDAINRGGFKINPEVVAALVRAHPSVNDATVVGLPDPRLGEVPAVALEVHPDRDKPSEAEIIALIRSQLPAYFAPVAVLILDQLPRTPFMKIDRKAVRGLFAAAATRPVAVAARR